MAKEISQIVEHERPDGYKEAFISVTDQETGETITGRTEWYYDGDRGTRVDYLVQDLMK